MFNYTEYFKLEAKCLFKDFQKSTDKALFVSQKYFGDRKNLTLMNFQHIVAKEYGFNTWKELISSDNGKLASVLIDLKNKEFTSPFSSWEENTKIQIEDEKIDLSWHCIPRLNQLIDKNKKIVSLGYGDKSIDISKVNYPLDVNLRCADVSDYDFSELHISRLLFNEETIWPNDERKMPKGPKPLDFINKRKKAGLNLPLLHKKGIDGRNHNMVMISDSKLTDHFEYHSNIKEYAEAGKRFDNNGASGFVSVAIGKKCGVAPGTNLYYYAVSRNEEAPNRQLLDYATFINKACDLHEDLLRKNANGIDVICIANRIQWHKMVDDEGFSNMQIAIERSKALGIFIISNSMNYDYGFYFGKAFCMADGDIDNIQDYETFDDASTDKKLFFPSSGSAVADFIKMGLYMYSPFDIYGPAWLSGLYILAKSLNTDLTANQFWEMSRKTAYKMQSGKLLINPTNLIEHLQKAF